MILSSDDLGIDSNNGYDYYEQGEHENARVYDEIYRAKIKKMDAEKIISETKDALRQNIEKSETKIKKRAQVVNRNKSKGMTR